MFACTVPPSSLYYRLYQSDTPIFSGSAIDKTGGKPYVHMISRLNGNLIQMTLRFIGRKNSTKLSCFWMQRVDSNHRPSAYEADELPNCYYSAIFHTQNVYCFFNKRDINTIALISLFNG